MSGTTYLFDSQRKNKSELVSKIKQIADGLEMDARLIGHGKEFVARGKPGFLALVKEIRLLKRHIRDYQALEKGLEKDPSSVNISLTLDKADRLLKGVMASLAVLNKNPLVEEARARTQEAVNLSKDMRPGL